MKLPAYLLMLISIFIFSCSKDNENKPKASCKITNQTETGSGGSGNDGYSFTNTKTFERDQNGNITKITFVSTYTFGDNTTSTGNKIETFEYDKDGFLLKEIIDNSSVGRDNSTYASKLTSTYEYSNKMLIKSTTTTSSAGGTGSSSYSFEYNNEGRLVKKVYTAIAPFPSSTVYEYGYSNGKFSTYTVTTGGVTTIQQIESDSKGRVLSITNAPYVAKYTYDTDGNRTVAEYLNNDKKTNMVKVTYDGKKNVELLMLPNRKGQPGDSFYALPSGNITQTQAFSYDNAGTEKIERSTTITYTYNGSNFPLTSSSSTSGSSISTNYQYSDCP